MLELNESERTALVGELRRYADYREGDLNPAVAEDELRGDLRADPTYAYDSDAMDQAVSKAAERWEQFTQERVSEAAPYRDLADQVEHTGRLDLSTTSTRRDVADVIDNTGWDLSDPGAQPPPEMRRVVEAHEVATDSIKTGPSGTGTTLVAHLQQARDRGAQRTKNALGAVARKQELPRHDPPLPQLDNHRAGPRLI